MLDLFSLPERLSGGMLLFLEQPRETSISMRNNNLSAWRRKVAFSLSLKRLLDIKCNWNLRTKEILWHSPKPS